MIIIRRYDSVVRKLALDRKKMAFISGPRQAGKTTFAKQLSSHFSQSLYKNWDYSEFRRQWKKSPTELFSEYKKTQDKKLLILDELHKAKNWKQDLKGFYDEFGTELSILLTGSARLQVYKKGGDSLMGRYYHFRFHPFSLGELHETDCDPEILIKNLDKKTLSKPEHTKTLQQLFQFSGFPEPFLAKDPKVSQIWRNSRRDKIIREDLRDLSRLPELSQIEMLAALLPERAASNINLENLREDLETSYPTVKRWANYLKELYYFFEIKPWSKKIPNSLKKEGKLYLYDWTEVAAPGARFENLLACHLLKACHFWSDSGEGVFDLYYLRNKQKEEIDFLIVKNNKPWLAIESKLSDQNVDLKRMQKFQNYLNCPMIQLTMQSDLYWKKESIYLLSADHFLSGLP